MRTVAPGDVEGVRREVLALLKDPTERQRLSSQARLLATHRHSCEAYVKTLASKLRELE
jgi:glycosyltransferase involved in cell wall biosynthesis